MSKMAHVRCATYGCRHRCSIWRCLGRALRAAQDACGTRGEELGGDCETDRHAFDPGAGRMRAIESRSKEDRGLGKAQSAGYGQRRRTAHCYKKGAEETAIRQGADD